MYQTQTIELSPLSNPEILEAADLFASPENLMHFVAASAEVVPDLYEQRLLARHTAEARLEHNMEFVREGEFDKAPAPIDVLGTARRVIEAERLFSKTSQQYVQIKQGLIDDCSRLYAEARRKNTFEYFPTVQHDYDNASGQFFAYGYSMRELVAGGLSPYVTQTEERQRRINENVEEITYETIMTLPIADNVNVLTISQCTDWALESYDKKPNGAHGGYVPEIQKMMIRGVSFDTSANCRYEEQIGIPGKLITNDIVNTALRNLDIINEHDQLNKTQVHATQAIINKEIISGVVDFVSMLDVVASEYYEQSVFLGEFVEPDFVKDYSRITTEAEERQQHYQQDSEELADFLIELEQKQTDVWVAEAIVEKHVREKLFDIVRHNPYEAHIIFDEKTAQGYEKVYALDEAGHHAEAREFEQAVQQSAPAAAFCGAGSCGLESAEKREEEEAARARMGSGNDETVVRDTERACGKCGEKGKVWYSFNTRIVRKSCFGCSALEINGKSVSLN